MVESGGEFSVALLDGQVVGFSKFTELAPGHGWLQGARVDVSIQNRGIGRALTQHHVALAKRIGLSTLRMVTDSDNTASRTLAEKVGFFLAGEYTRYRCKPLDSTETGHFSPVPLFKGLPPIPDNGIVSAGWTFYPWNQELMETWAEEGKLYGTEQAGMAMMHGNRPERINIPMLWGSPDSMADLLTFARKQPEGVERINCIVPDQRYKQVLLDTGYENLDDHTMVVYQTNL